jgi:hypothetical protein
VGHGAACCTHGAATDPSTLSRFPWQRHFGSRAARRISRTARTRCAPASADAGRSAACSARMRRSGGAPGRRMQHQFVADGHRRCSAPWRANGATERPRTEQERAERPRRFATSPRATSIPPQSPPQADGGAAALGASRRGRKALFRTAACCALRSLGAAPCGVGCDTAPHRRRRRRGRSSGGSRHADASLRSAARGGTAPVLHGPPALRLGRAHRRPARRTARRRSLRHGGRAASSPGRRARRCRSRRRRPHRRRGRRRAPGGCSHHCAAQTAIRRRRPPPSFEPSLHGSAAPVRCLAVPCWSSRCAESRVREASGSKEGAGAGSRRAGGTACRRTLDGGVSASRDSACSRAQQRQRSSISAASLRV